MYEDKISISEYFWFDNHNFIYYNSTFKTFFKTIVNVMIGCRLQKMDQNLLKYLQSSMNEITYCHSV